MIQGSLERSDQQPISLQPEFPVRQIFVLFLKVARKDIGPAVSMTASTTSDSSPPAGAPRMPQRMDSEAAAGRGSRCFPLREWD